MTSLERNRYALTARGQKYAYQGLELPYFVFELKDPVRPELLCRAARQAVALHPLFGTSLVLDGIYYLEKDSGWEQHPEGTVIAGGAGRRLWEISCVGRKVILTGSHALADGMGFMQFAATVFHLYFELCGVRFSEAARTDLPEAPEKTTVPPGDLCPELPDACVGVPHFPAPSPLPAACFSAEESHSIHFFEFSENELRRFANRSETSVFSVVACLLARAAEETFQLREGCISVRVPVDCRRAFGICTDHNFSQGFSLCYRPEKMSRLPDALVEMAFRSQLDLYTDRDNLIRTVQRDLRRLQELKEGAVSFDSYRQYAEGHGGPKAQILYTHLTRPGFSEELAATFRRFFMICDSPVAHSIQVGATSFNGTVSVGVNQHVVDQRFIRALTRALEKKGMVFELREVSLPEVLGNQSV